MTTTNPGASTPLAPGARRPKLRPHAYDPDKQTPAPWPGRPRPCRCGLQKANAIHDEKALAALAETAHAAHAEEMRRLGERED